MVKNHGKWSGIQERIRILQKLINLFLARRYSVLYKFIDCLIFHSYGCSTFCNNYVNIGPWCLLCIGGRKWACYRLCLKETKRQSSCDWSYTWYGRICQVLIFTWPAFLVLIWRYARCLLLQLCVCMSPGNKHKKHSILLSFFYGNMFTIELSND